jgi:hypothetical protein
MAFIKIIRNKLEDNYKFLDEIFKSRNIQWGSTKPYVVNTYLQEIIKLGVREITTQR